MESAICYRLDNYFRLASNHYNKDSIHTILKSYWKYYNYTTISHGVYILVLLHSTNFFLLTTYLAVTCNYFSLHAHTRKRRRQDGEGK